MISTVNKYVGSKINLVNEESLSTVLITLSKSWSVIIFYYAIQLASLVLALTVIPSDSIQHGRTEKPVTHGLVICFLAAGRVPGTQ